MVNTLFNISCEMYECHIYTLYSMMCKYFIGINIILCKVVYVHVCGVYVCTCKRVCVYVSVNIKLLLFVDLFSYPFYKLTWE